MPVTLQQARNEILGRAKVLTDALVLTLPTVVYDNAPSSIPKTATPWARVTLRHADAEQATLADSARKAIYTSTGLLIVEISVPSSRSIQPADDLANTIRNGFCGYATPGGVWFRNQRVVEIGNVGVWFQMNVYVDFQYDEYK